MSRIAGIVQQGQSKFSELDAALSATENFNLLQTCARIKKIVEIDTHCLGWIGRQGEPFVEQDGLVLLLDGYIYNDKDFVPGFLVDLYRRYGFTGMLSHLNGDFVIVLHDKFTNELWIGRDRFGIKPLYYAIYPEYFCFASRIVSLFKFGIKALPDPIFIGRFAGTHYRYIDNVPEKSPYLGIYQLPAAHYLQIKTSAYSYDESSVEIKSWWTPYDGTDFEAAEERIEELALQYRALLLDAVKLRLGKAGKPAFTLSGGMDSSSVLASAVYHTGEKFHAFSTVYEDKTYDETDEIQSMLKTTVHEWHRVNIGNPDVLDLVKRMIEQHDEPVATATWLSHFLLCEVVAAEGFGSLFGGLGGDELNAGEYEYFFFYFADLLRSHGEACYVHEVSKWCEHHDHPIFKKNLKIARQGMQRMVDLTIPGQCLPEKTRMFRYLSALNRDFFSETFHPRLEHPFTFYLKNRTYQDLYFETAPCCLRAEDRQATAYGLEHFLPFFDYRLVEFMFRIPNRLKIRDGVTKVLLRHAMKGILPEETRTRIKKTGWNAPAHQWFTGEGLNHVRDLVHSRTFRDRRIYNEVELYRIIDEHESIMREGRAQENHMMFLWQLINLEFWLRSHD